MRRIRLIRPLGFVLAGLLALSIGTRPSLKAQQSPASIASASIGGAFGGGSQKENEMGPPPVYLPAPPMTLAETKTRLKLHDKVPMHFPPNTSLETVKKYLEESTKDPRDFPDGIPTYVDPQGLADADKTMASTVAFDLNHVPLETSLNLVLKQVGLTYRVNKDGLLIITSLSDSETLLTPADLDQEILSSLSALREEVRTLRAEVHLLRSGGLPGEIDPGRQPSGSTTGGMGSKGGMM